MCDCMLKEAGRWTERRHYTFVGVIIYNIPLKVAKIKIVKVKIVTFLNVYK